MKDMCMTSSTPAGKEDKHIILHLLLVSWYPTKNWFPSAQPKAQSAVIHNDLRRDSYLVWYPKHWLYCVKQVITPLLSEKQLKLCDANVSSHPSIHLPTQLPPEGFLWNFMLKIFACICQHSPCLFKVRQK